jgi:hypothetical protein
MSKRITVPKSTREQVLAEFNHRCALCGEVRPQVHHIDENPGNNDPFNLLPLCPNCHLTDQHNPTKTVDRLKLYFFRRHKDPTILKPQFEPLFSRARFLFVLDEVGTLETLKSLVVELQEFVAVLEMGAFYSSRLNSLLMPSYQIFVDAPDSDVEVERLWREHERQYRDKVQANRDAALKLLVELLRYQKW